MLVAGAHGLHATVCRCRSGIFRHPYMPIANGGCASPDIRARRPFAPSWYQMIYSRDNERTFLAHLAGFPRRPDWTRSRWARVFIQRGAEFCGLALARQNPIRRNSTSDDLRPCAPLQGSYPGDGLSAPDVTIRSPAAAAARYRSATSCALVQSSDAAPLYSHRR